MRRAYPWRPLILAGVLLPLLSAPLRTGAAPLASAAPVSHVGHTASSPAGAAGQARVSPLGAPTIVVTTAADGGPGSLRAALVAAPGGAAITFAANLGPITLTSGQLEITSSLRISGPTGGTQTIGGGSATRVVQVDAGTQVTLTNLTITGGQTAAGIDGAGIYNAGSLLIVASTVTGNATGGGSDGSTGGDGAGTPGGNGGAGGGIYNAGALTLTNSTLAGNTTGKGGQGGEGGGCFCFANGGPGGNGGAGAGIYNAGALTLTNSTLAGNTTGSGGNGGGGGGIFASNGGNGGGGGSGAGLDTNAAVTTTTSTLAGNTTGTGGSGGNPGAGGVPGANGSGGAGGGLYSAAGTASLGATILAGNTAAGSGADVGCAGTVTSRDYNLVQTTTGCTLVEPSPSHDLFGQDPLLGPLQANGGPTLTQAPSPASPVVDRVPPRACALAADQRGAPRPDEATDGGACDSGAVESGPPPHGTLTVSPPTATPFQTLTLTGTAFAAGEGVAVYWDRQTTPAVVTPTATGAGTVAAQLAVPPTSAGAHTLLAVGQASGTTATAPVQVTPLLVLSPTVQAAGGAVVAQGFGFGAREQVRLSWDAPVQALGTATTTGSGTFSGSTAVTITVPPNAAPGQHVVYGVGQTSHGVGAAQITVH